MCVVIWVTGLFGFLFKVNPPIIYCINGTRGTDFKSLENLNTNSLLEENINKWQIKIPFHLAFSGPSLWHTEANMRSS